MGKKKISLARVVQVAQGEWNILWEGMGIFQRGDWEQHLKCE